MKNAIRKFIRDQEGTELVEWGLIAGLIIVVAAGIFVGIGTDLTTIFSALATNVGSAATAAG
jgi:pilus assembly protein Flp/PilA